MKKKPKNDYDKRKIVFVCDTLEDKNNFLKKVEAKGNSYQNVLRFFIRNYK